MALPFPLIFSSLSFRLEFSLSHTLSKFSWGKRQVEAGFMGNFAQDQRNFPALLSKIKSVIQGPPINSFMGWPFTIS